jgi:Calcineurin-like phosphoesterase
MPSMLRLSADPAVAEKQMQAVIFYVTTFGYIDGEFDHREKLFISDYIRRLVDHHVRTHAADLPAGALSALIEKRIAHSHAFFEQTDREIQEMFTEIVAHDENIATFVHNRLKVRCFEIFQEFDHDNQEELMQAIDELLMADGEAHPAEIMFRGELAQLLEADLAVELVDETPTQIPTMNPEEAMPSKAAPHTFFEPFEQDYADDPETMRRQIDADVQAIARTHAVLEAWRRNGAGKLDGKGSVAELAGEDLFLDGHTWVCAPKPGRRYELIVLGDLHGCYSCLKGAVIQSGFFDKVRRFHDDPATQPEPKLVLLGDYIDRGRFSLNGVLRAALQLFCSAPEHVVLLRGNHEYFIEVDGVISGGVRPSEAIDGLKHRVSADLFRAYMRLFDDLPSTFIFERTVFTHGGIPRDRTFKRYFTDLSSLNDPVLRFEMMWSDPSSADVIPVSLQEPTARFQFGRLQAQHFLRRLGCHSLIRGHEKINEGLRLVYDDRNVFLLTLFSAGGRDNRDLPPVSSYRQVTPKAITLRHENGRSAITPWTIDWAPYNHPSCNAFFRELGAAKA